MKRSRSDVHRLIAELESDVQDLHRVAAENQPARLDELRSFRHLFRNLYARPLDPERTRFVQAKVSPAVSAFQVAHITFIDRLNSIALALDDQD